MTPIRCAAISLVLGALSFPPAAGAGRPKPAGPGDSDRKGYGQAERPSGSERI
jgi:hypothetical protein